MDSITGFLTGAGTVASDLIGGAVTGFDTLGQVLGFLTSARGWIRIFEVAFGGLLIFGALKYGN